MPMTYSDESMIAYGILGGMKCMVFGCIISVFSLDATWAFLWAWTSETSGTWIVNSHPNTSPRRTGRIRYIGAVGVIEVLRVMCIIGLILA